MAVPTPPKVIAVPAGATPAEAQQIAQANAQNRQEYRETLREHEERQAADRAIRQKAARKAATMKALHGHGILPDSKDVRFIDAAVAVPFAGAYAVWSASRPTATQRLAWGLGGALVGTLAFVEGRGSVLKYGGAFTAAGSAAVLALELVGLTKKGL